jgi:hypothetical protein
MNNHLSFCATRGTLFDGFGSPDNILEFFGDGIEDYA